VTKATDLHSGNQHAVELVLSKRVLMPVASAISAVDLKVMRSPASARVLSFARAVGNFCGPLHGSLFDPIGRKAMIAETFVISGSLLTAGYRFAAGFLTRVTQD
jgi:hypothetical protein